MEYLLSEQISIAPSYSLFFPEDPFGLSAINIDARYYLMMEDTEFYFLLGYASLRAEASVGAFTVSTTDGGINFGTGANFGLNDKLKINTQLKYQSAGDGQVVFNTGLVIGF